MIRSVTNPIVLGLVLVSLFRWPGRTIAALLSTIAVVVLAVLFAVP
jgi:hypothetical protein